jgi:hypothetical protein
MTESQKVRKDISDMRRNTSSVIMLYSIDSRMRRNDNQCLFASFSIYENQFQVLPFRRHKKPLEGLIIGLIQNRLTRSYAKKKGNRYYCC